MKISVIIPTYNRAALITDSIDSLCKQDLNPAEFEILIVDNNSKDETRRVVEDAIAAYKEHTIRYVFEPRQGDYFARNRGAEEAEGEYLVFTDDDALFDTNYLSTILGLFERYPDVGAVGTRIDIKWEGGTPANWIKPYEYLLGAISRAKKGYMITNSGLYINNGSLAIKKALYIEVGGNNPGQIGDYLIGDAEGGLCRKLHKRGVVIAFTDDVSMHHRQFVEKNDTVADIKRRVENIGISNAYTAVFEGGNAKFLSLRKDRLQYYYYTLTMHKRKALRAYFKLCEQKKYNEYIVRFCEDEEIKKLIAATKYEWGDVK